MLQTLRLVMHLYYSMPKISNACFDELASQGKLRAIFRRRQSIESWPFFCNWAKPSFFKRRKAIVTEGGDTETHWARAPSNPFAPALGFEGGCRVVFWEIVNW